MTPLIKKKSVIHLVSKNSYPYLTQKRSEFWRVNTIALIGFYPPIRACACNKVEVGISSDHRQFRLFSNFILCRYKYNKEGLGIRLTRQALFKKCVDSLFS